MKKLYGIIIASSLVLSNVALFSMDPAPEQGTPAAQEPTENVAQKSPYTQEEINLIQKYLTEKQLDAFIHSSPKMQQQYIAQLREIERLEGLGWPRKMALNAKEYSKQIIQQIPGALVQGFVGAVISGITSHCASKILNHEFFGYPALFPNNEKHNKQEADSWKDLAIKTLIENKGLKRENKQLTLSVYAILERHPELFKQNT